MIDGAFETHITVAAGQAEGLASFAAERGFKFVHIELDRGVSRWQPMLTLRNSGTLERQLTEAQKLCEQMQALGIAPIRIKIEATPWSTGVPQTDAEARDEPAGRYFEHHVKVLLPSARVADLLAVTGVAERHGARLSRNARRRGPQGRQERFVNQRCHRVGLATATERLDALVADLRAAGHEVISAEQEYVAHDSRISLDHGWLVPVAPAYQEYYEDRKRTAAAGPSFPPTYRPVPDGWDVEQRAAFDPSLRPHANAYTAGEPVFADPVLGQRWRDARRAAMRHLLTVLAATRWADHLVLRGSATMQAWVGPAARDPGDLDFVVTPPTVTSHSADAHELLEGITAALTATPGAGLQPDRAAQSAIWTDERADGRRLVIPFWTPGLPEGAVQIDIVFGEHLPIVPEQVTIFGVPVTAVTADLSLAWKLMWLATDSYPQGKDLYDAATTPLGWIDTDWRNVTDAYPEIEGTATDWLHRLALALDHAWQETELTPWA